MRNEGTVALALYRHRPGLKNLQQEDTNRPNVSAFLQVSTGLMTIATQKELQEVNISLLLNPTSWNEGMNEEADFDVLSLDE